MEFDLEKYAMIIDFIKEAHGKQMRAFTKVPYWTHPIRVANLVMKYKESRELDSLVVAALLHDIVEDTGIVLRISDGFPNIEVICESLGIENHKLVLDLVSELTSNPSEVKQMGKTEYLIEKMISMSSWGLVIKLCDRLDNVTDFMFAPHGFIRKYRNETYRIIGGLETQRKEISRTHNAIMWDIKAILSIYDAL